MNAKEFKIILRRKIIWLFSGFHNLKAFLQCCFFFFPQFINIVVNLLDALKTSFSHRSLAARSMGRKDSVSDAALAGIAMFKTYVRSFGTNDDKCLQKYVCDANTECSDDIGPKSVFCQFGT